jgi:hypothetical protein
MTNGGGRARPDDKPFDFNLDAVKSEVDLTPFVVHFAQRSWSFAHLKGLNVWDLIADVEGGDIQAGVRVFEIALGADVFAEFRKIPLPQFRLEALFKAYEEFCGVESGESEASTPS